MVKCLLSLYWQNLTDKPKAIPAVQSFIKLRTVFLTEILTVLDETEEGADNEAEEIITYTISSEVNFSSSKINR